MEVQKVNIYHCITCGRIVRDELENASHTCCGHAMTKAVTEKTREDDMADKIPQDVSEPDILPIEGHKKPR